MRTIKFRGKRVDTGEWAYGNYIEKIKPTEVVDVFWCGFIQDKAISMYKVIPETAGQFTGLTDKNGKEIYEGDILVAPDSSQDIWLNGNEYRCVVKYNNSYTRFLLSFYSIYGGEGFSGNQETDQMCVYVKDGYYVAGNIHNNPELLT